MSIAPEASLVTLEFGSRLSMVRPMVALVHELALAAGLGQDRAIKLQLAAEEVITNIIRHGYEGRHDGRIAMTCKADEAALTLDFTERGVPFDFSMLPVYDPSADAWDPTGLGVHLARQSVDELSFENLGVDGKRVQLRVHLHEGGTPFMEMPPWDRTEFHHAEDEAAHIEVRRMVSDDALSLAQCAYRTWGYGYNDFIYHPDQVRAMLADGRLTSVVAVCDGQVIGHTALKKRFSEDSVAEAGMAFVDPQVRSRSLLARMVAALESDLSGMGLQGIFALQVTSHTISQKVGYSQGFRDCGLLLRAPARVQEDAQAGAHAQRRSAVVLCYRPHGPQRTRRIHAPPGLRTLLERVYTELGLPVQWDDSFVPPPQATAQAARVRCSRTRALRTADIEVLQHGHDTLEAVEYARRVQHRVGVDALFVHLDLEDGSSAALAESLTMQGLVFAGVLPGARRGRDLLILQSVNLTEQELDAVELLHPFPQEVLALVRQSLSGSSG